jgi:hypothetical protein
LQKVTEMMQAGIIDPNEGRRLLNYPDLEQSDKLALAAKERIFKTLDDIVDTGKYEPPDPYTDLAEALKIVVQYYNMYAPAGLEESKLELLRTWHQQCLALQSEAMQPAPGAMPGAEGGAQLAVPEAAPTNPMMPRIA